MVPRRMSFWKLWTLVGLLFAVGGGLQVATGQSPAGKLPAGKSPDPKGSDTSLPQLSPPAYAWFPDTLVAITQVENLGSAWEQIQTTGIWEKFWQLPEVTKGMQSPQGRQFQLGRKFIENLVGQPLEELAAELTAQPALLGLDRNREFALLFSPAPGAYERLKKLVEDLAQVGNFGQNGPAIRAVQYKGIPAYAIDRARLAFHSGRILVSSGNTLGRAILDRALGEKEHCLPDAPWFQLALPQISHRPEQRVQISGAIDLEWVRESGQLRLPMGKEIGQELLVGGVVEVWQQAPWVTFQVGWADHALQFQVAVPLSQPLPETRSYFFGSGAGAAGPLPKDLPGRLLSVRWHRDLGAFWKMIPQIVSDENALAELAKNESEISTLFGGMITVGDVFDYLGPGLELVACLPEFDSDQGQPEIKLPKFGLVGTLREPERAEKALRLAFQQVVSFSNLNAGAGKYPPLEVVSEKVDATRFLTASYLALDSMSMQSADTQAAPSSSLYLNFSPTLAIQSDRFVLASDRRLAEQLLQASSTAGAPPGDLENSVLEIWPEAIVQIARMNFEPLVAQRMLETGHDRSTAVREVELGLALAGCFQSIGLKLCLREGQLVFDAQARLAPR